MVVKEVYEEKLRIKSNFANGMIITNSFRVELTLNDRNYTKKIIPQCM